MNILLTGATGFLGAELAKRFIKDGHSVYCIVRDSKKAKEKFLGWSNIHFLAGDVTEKNVLQDKNEEVILHNTIDAFYHLAALVKFDEHLRDELMEINYEGTKNTLKLAERIGVKRYYYVSTAYTVGKKEYADEGLHETQLEYNNPYEESKCKAEHEVFNCRNRMDVSIFRPSIIVGDSKTGKADSLFTLYGFMRGLEVFKKRMGRKTKSEEVYRIVGLEEGTSNFVPVDYVSDVLYHALYGAEKETIYHITNDAPPTNKEILTLVKGCLHFENLMIVKSMDGLREEEWVLNKMVSVFQHYLGRNIHFESKNTKELLKKANLRSLEMDQNTLERIIKAYRMN